MLIDRKPKFRSRKLDFSKTLAVYRFNEIDEFDDYDEPLRSVVQVATGVDKEEEDVLIFCIVLSSALDSVGTPSSPSPDPPNQQDSALLHSHPGSSTED